ncbi:unnamed protein product [Enterobius vermicularis]|uniref:C3H1-type domain-containing protein n=1 Tax=Enterobius vermicularis TaxID=51028 RepID=A0A0N4VKK4_ENTVE|nr:unnamed protein product [Enterobius vermicularis]
MEVGQGSKQMFSTEPDLTIDSTNSAQIGANHGSEVQHPPDPHAQTVSSENDQSSYDWTPWSFFTQPRASEVDEQSTVATQYSFTPVTADSEQVSQENAGSVMSQDFHFDAVPDAINLTAYVAGQLMEASAQLTVGRTKKKGKGKQHKKRGRKLSGKGKKKHASFDPWRVPPTPPPSPVDSECNSDSDAESVYESSDQSDDEDEQVAAVQCDLYKFCGFCTMDDECPLVHRRYASSDSRC